VTKDGPYVDGAGVLGESVRRAHQRSKFSYSLLAIVHPTVHRSRAPLEAMGFRILERDIPFPLSDIENQQYATQVQSNGCCGHLELLKLHAWGLTDYHRVVHLDMDSFVLEPMDELFDLNVTLVYTKDYNMAPGRPVRKAPVQGGFLLVRPSLAEMNRLWDVVKRGDFRRPGGWGGSGIGNFWGGMTIQGLVPYFYTELASPRASLEVNRCLYNQMVDAAGDPTSRSSALAKMSVPNCRQVKFDEVKNVHFTICQKPWICVAGHAQPLCRAFHREWFAARESLEERLGIEPGRACPRPGENSYIPIAVPRIQTAIQPGS